jgi:VIT1/CCC1 family predicted Fe2+/Mn2+ transporter
VVSAGLGVVSLTGSWVGTVASARESLVGQLSTSSSSDVATLIEKGYGNAWQATALWGGVFALVALIVGVVVLARPAFGAPGRPQAPWIKSVSWAGVALGVIGLLLAVLKYTDVLLGLPSAS